MKISRRTAIGGLLGAALHGPAGAQGVASRNVHAQTRGKPSGIPFLAQFTDIAANAGLRSPTIYGSPTKPTTSSKPSAAAPLSSITITTAGSISSCSTGRRLNGVPAGTPIASTATTATAPSRT